MAVKYHCRKCGKRFMDWGAEKLGFKCPDCEDEELIRVGLSDEKTPRKPSLKRRPRRAAPVVHTSDEDVLVADIEDIEAEEVEVEAEDEDQAALFVAGDEGDAAVGLDLAEVLPAEDLTTGEGVDLVADEFPAAPVAEEGIEEPVTDTEEWPV